MRSPCLRVRTPEGTRSQVADRQWPWGSPPGATGLGMDAGGSRRLRPGRGGGRGVGGGARLGVPLGRRVAGRERSEGAQGPNRNRRGQGPQAATVRDNAPACNAPANSMQRGAARSHRRVLALPSAMPVAAVAARCAARIAHAKAAVERESTEGPNGEGRSRAGGLEAGVRGARNRVTAHRRDGRTGGRAQRGARREQQSYVALRCNMIV